MDKPTDSSTAWEALIGHDVVVDVDSPYVYIGTLHRAETHWLELTDADVHDMRDTQSTRELYVLDARRYGVNRNRARVWVRTERVVSVSCLADVVAE